MTRDVAEQTTWTTRQLLAWMGDAFAKKGLDNPRLMAEMLVSHVIGCERLKLYTDPDRPASPLERGQLRELAGRALKHEPVQYLVGHAWFFGLRFHVDPRVLIPRPSSETIVEHVLQDVRARHGQAGGKGEGLLIADVCCGSGCLAIALLKHLPQARAAATDISKDALDVARVNASVHGVADRLDLINGDLLAALSQHPIARSTGSVDYLVSNPPYIPDDEWPAVAPNVKDHEPHLALRGGVDGLDLVRRVVADAPFFIKPGGMLLIEVADSRAQSALALAQASGDLRDAKILHDFEGLARVVAARRA